MENFDEFRKVLEEHRQKMSALFKNSHDCKLEKLRLFFVQDALHHEQFLS